MKFQEPTEDQGPMPEGDYNRLEIDRDRLKEELAIANKLLARIAVICTGGLDPELTREQVIGRVKVIYSLAAFDDAADEILGSGVLRDDAAGVAERP